MASFRRTLLSLFLLSCGVYNIHAQAPLLLENPTISKTQIAFTYGGDIWTVDRKGGSAQRLTSDPAREISPVFSPDGSKVAFARLNPAAGPAAWDVYVASSSGGDERRITYHPDIDFPVNWTPDGKNILIVSFRYRTFPSMAGSSPFPRKAVSPLKCPYPVAGTARFLLPEIALPTRR